MNKKSNKQAFPTMGFREGMDLTDYFAGQVINYTLQHIATYDNAVKSAYDIAEAMMQERSKRL